MPSRVLRVPKYRYHKGSGQAFVQIKGRRFYLGKFGSEESRERYRRAVAELCASPARVVPEQSASVPGEGPKVVEIVRAYWEHAQSYYIKDGVLTDHIYTVRTALRLLRELYGRSPACEFGPLAFRGVQQHMIDDDRSRHYINDVCGTIKRVFKWAASQELIPVAVYQGLATVPGLKKGRTAARETDPVQPVPNGVVEATLPDLTRVVADMVRLQRLMGCRPAEVCIIRPCDVDTSGDVWAYRPESHKTEHHGRERVIFIGPQAQTVLRPYLLRGSEDYCFSPAESERLRKAEMRAHRKTRVQPSQRDRSKRHPKRKPGERYTTASYRRAIQRAVERANRERQIEARLNETPESDIELLPKWSPNQLRHAAATEIRKRFGLEAAQVALGHATADVSQIYAERDMTLAAEVMRKIG